MADLLTPSEHQLVELLAHVANLFSDIVGDDRSRNGDIAEAVDKIHALQNMVLSQAAARAYPAMYRLLGETVDEAEPT